MWAIGGTLWPCRNTVIEASLEPSDEGLTWSFRNVVLILPASGSRLAVRAQLELIFVGAFSHPATLSAMASLQDTRCLPHVQTPL